MVVWKFRTTTFLLALFLLSQEEKGARVEVKWMLGREENGKA